jgi:hypothetical protein
VRLGEIGAVFEGAALRLDRSENHHDEEVKEYRDRVRLPFAGLAFASVMSMMPGFYLFRMVSGMVDLVAFTSKARQKLFDQVVAHATMAILIILAMSFGLIFPKMCIPVLTRSLFHRTRRGQVSLAPRRERQDAPIKRSLLSE